MEVVEEVLSELRFVVVGVEEEQKEHLVCTCRVPVPCSSSEHPGPRLQREPSMIHRLEQPSVCVVCVCVRAQVSQEKHVYEKMSR